MAMLGQHCQALKLINNMEFCFSIVIAGAQIIDKCYLIGCGVCLMQVIHIGQAWNGKFSMLGSPPTHYNCHLICAQRSGPIVILRWFFATWRRINVVAALGG